VGEVVIEIEMDGVSGIFGVVADVRTCRGWRGVLLEGIGGILMEEQLLYRLLEGLAFVEGSGVDECVFVNAGTNWRDIRWRCGS
jgi:hypothetical protein